VVQFTPPGSCCSVHFGKNVTSAAPGSAKAFLIVTDIEAARDHLVAVGVEVGEFFHDVRKAGAAACIPRVFPAARAPYSVIPTATSGTCRRSRPGTRCVSNLARLPSAPQATLQGGRCMSGLPPRADIRVTHRHVCFGPFPDSCTAANSQTLRYLVGAGGQRWSKQIFAHGQLKGGRRA
jgi:hypothetical protein